MMKIIKGNDTYLFPERCQRIVLTENKNSLELIKCFSEYFGKKKKKNYCHIYSDDEDPILPNEFEFIYFSSNSNMDLILNFGSKTVLNQEISRFIIENEKAFQSINHIREEIRLLLTDSGMFRLRKILEYGLDKHIEMRMNDFNISSILESFFIAEESLNETEKILLVYNLLLYIARLKSCIVYLDLPITPILIKWMDSFINKPVLFVLNNSLTNLPETEMKDISILKLSNQNYMENYEFDGREFFSILYVLTPLVEQFIDMQTEKNKKIYRQFEDNGTTFFLEFNNQKYQNVP